MAERDLSKKLSADGPSIAESSVIKDCTFGPFTEVGEECRLSNVSMEAYSYVTRHCDIANASLGRFVNVASFVRIGATDHPLDRASLHHFMYRSADYWDDAEHDAEWFEKRAARRAFIGHDTWLGHNCQIKPEVRIGDGAVVASGAVVTRDVAPYTIVAGVPAKPLRDRQPAAIAERLIELAWWDWSHEELRETLDDFRNLEVEAFLEKYEG